jgi:hypothetical protein
MSQTASTVRNIILNYTPASLVRVVTLASLTFLGLLSGMPVASPLDHQLVFVPEDHEVCFLVGLLSPGNLGLPFVECLNRVPITGSISKRAGMMNTSERVSTGTFCRKFSRVSFSVEVSWSNSRCDLVNSCSSS